MADADDIYGNWATDPEVCRFWPWQPHKSIEETKALLAGWIADYEKSDYYHWAIVLKNVSQAIGYIYLADIDDTDHSISVHAALSRRYWNQGIMTEACKQVINFAFNVLGAEKVRTKHHIDNPGSGRVLEKSGMKHVKTEYMDSPDFERLSGDYCYYEIHKEDPPMAIKVGVVGLGGIGRTHARNYQSDPLAQLLAVCDINRERADQAAEEFGVKAYYSIKDMVEGEPDMEAVSVCTSGYENGSMHFEPSFELLEYGKKVLCEKPLCADIRDARALVKYALDRRQVLACNLNHYFTETAAAARKRMDAGEVGELVYCLHKMGFDGSDTAYPGKIDPQSRWNKPYSHVKAFLTHPFSVMRYFCGDISHVQAFLERPGVRRTAGDPMLSINSINCKFENGGVGVLLSQRGDARWGLGGWWSYEHVGAKGTFCIENCVEKLTYWGGHQQDDEGKLYLPEPEVMNTGVTSFDATFTGRIHAWLEDLTNDVHYEYVRSSGRDALATLEYIEAAIQSYEQGGATVRPHPLPAMHGTPEYVH